MSIMITLDDLLYDIHILEDEIRSYERKYGMLAEIFYEAYAQGEEPADDAWVRDWTAWAGLYKLWLRRREQYKTAIDGLRSTDQTLSEMIQRTARHEPIPIPA
jgi:hypothetical protein